MSSSSLKAWDNFLHILQSSFRKRISLLFDFIKRKASETIRLAGNFLNSFKTLMINGDLSAKRSRIGVIMQPQFSHVNTKSMICYNSSAFSSTLRLFISLIF